MYGFFVINPSVGLAIRIAQIAAAFGCLDSPGLGIPVRWLPLWLPVPGTAMGSGTVGPGESQHEKCGAIAGFLRAWSVFCWANFCDDFFGSDPIQENICIILYCKLWYYSNTNCIDRHDTIISTYPVAFNHIPITSFNYNKSWVQCWLYKNGISWVHTLIRMWLVIEFLSLNHHFSLVVYHSCELYPTIANRNSLPGLQWLYQRLWTCEFLDAWILRSGPYAATLGMDEHFMVYTFMYIIYIYIYIQYIYVDTHNIHIYIYTYI